MGFLDLFKRELPNVDSLEQKNDVDALIRVLTHIKYGKDKDTKGYSVREDAAHALGRIGDIKAVEVLISVLKDEDWAVQMAAAESLGQIGDKRAIKPLKECIESAVNIIVLKAAEKALAQISKP